MAAAAQLRPPSGAPMRQKRETATSRMMRPPDWEESSDEGDDAACLNDATCSSPTFSATWWGHLCRALHVGASSVPCHKGWERFDEIASQILGLDESKFEWAIVEKELQEHQELESLATDSVVAAQQADAMELGARPLEPTQPLYMSRDNPAPGASRDAHASLAVPERR